MPGPKIEYEPPKEPTPERPPEKPPEKSELNFARVSKKAAQEIIIEAKSEFPPEIQVLIEKWQAKTLTPKERSQFDKFREQWWKERFGISFSTIHSKKKEKIVKEKALPKSKETLSAPNLKKEKPSLVKKREAIQSQKKELMAELHVDLSNLDAGRRVERLQEQWRRVIHYDESGNRYFILEKSGPRYLAISDILSDYAWGIKYAPDKDMPSQVLRHLSKRILVNETRRQIEELYNNELAVTTVGVGPHQSIADMVRDWYAVGQSTRNAYTGFVAETMSREWLSRIAADFGFVVLRANCVEDYFYKYDFKFRFLRRLRGVGIKESEGLLQRDLSAVKKLGIQFTINHHKRNILLKVKEAFGRDLPVDEILLVEIKSKEFGIAFDRWLTEGKPSGGPEQFLSQELKDDLLKKATAGLFKAEKV